jgi:hypothetical protein
MKMFGSEGLIPENQAEKKPKYRLGITRHADRMPSGKLTPDGVEKASQKGARNKGNVKVYKAYASTDKSKRALDTAKLISEGTDAKSPLTGQRYKTRTVKDIEYGVLKPEYSGELKKASDMINEATLNELGLSTERNEKGELLIDLTNLPDEEQIKIGPTRKANQPVGMRYVIDKPEVMHRIAMGMANQLSDKLELVKRYDRRFKQGEGNELEGDAILDINTHGLFMESVLQTAGVRVKEDGSTEEGINNFEDESFGGYLDPAESVYIDIDDPQNMPKLLPVVFEREGRPGPGQIFIDRDKLLKLQEDYKKWRGPETPK